MFRHGTSVTKLARGLLIAYRLRGVTLGTARSKTSFSGGDVKQCRLVWISKFFQAKDDLLKVLRSVISFRGGACSFSSNACKVFESSGLVTACKRSSPRAADSSICRTFRLTAASRISFG